MSNVFLAYRYYKPKRSQKNSCELIMKEYIGNFHHSRTWRKLIDINGKCTADSTRYLLFGINCFQKCIT